MMEHNFIAGSANIDELDPDAQEFPIVCDTQTGVALTRVMSNSFGFGGTNSSLIFARLD